MIEIITSHCRREVRVALLENGSGRTVVLKLRSRRAAQLASRDLARMFGGMWTVNLDHPPVSFDAAHLASLERIRNQLFALESEATVEIGERVLAGSSREDLKELLGHTRVLSKIEEDVAYVVNELKDAIKVKETASE